MDRMSSVSPEKTEMSQDNCFSSIKPLLQRERGQCPLGIGLEILELNGSEGNRG